MKEKPLLIVMLTYNDKTIVNALDAFEKCKNSSAEYWGIKEEGLSLLKMKELFTQIKRNGKKAVLEVVAYTEDECLEGAKIAAECGCDILMGTMFFESVNVFCKENDIKYMPEKLDQASNFANKIWNAAKFIKSNLVDEKDIINYGNKSYIYNHVDNYLYFINLNNHIHLSISFHYT